MYLPSAVKIVKVKNGFVLCLLKMPKEEPREEVFHAIETGDEGLMVKLIQDHLGFEVVKFEDDDDQKEDDSPV